MSVRERRCQSSPRRPIQKSNLNQIRFDDLLDRVFLFVNGSGNRAQADWSTVELLDYRQQQLSIHLVEAVGVDFHAIQRVVCNFLVDAAVEIDLRIVVDAPKQSVDYARRAARPARDFTRPLTVDFNAKNVSGTFADHFEILVRVEVEMKDYAETSAQGSCN